LTKQINTWINPPGNVSDFFYEPKENEDKVYFPSSDYYNTTNIDEKYQYNEKYDSLLKEEYGNDSILFEIIDTYKIITNKVFYDCIKLYEKENKTDVLLCVIEFNTPKDITFKKSSFKDKIPNDLTNIDNLKTNKEVIKIYFLYKHLFKYDSTDFKEPIVDIDDIEEISLDNYRYIEDKIKEDVLRKNYSNSEDIYLKKHKIDSKLLYFSNKQRAELNDKIKTEFGARVIPEVKPEVKPEDKIKTKAEAKYSDNEKLINDISYALKTKYTFNNNLNSFLNFANSYIKQNKFDDILFNFPLYKIMLGDDHLFTHKRLHQYAYLLAFSRLFIC
jgi:hypothetical protein